MLVFFCWFIAVCRKVSTRSRVVLFVRRWLADGCCIIAQLKMRCVGAEEGPPCKRCKTAGHEVRPISNYKMTVHD